MFLSNLNATKEPWMFCGKKQLSIYGIPPTVTGGSVNLTIISCGSICDLSITADEGDFCDPKELRDIFRQKYEELIENRVRKT